MNSSSVEPRILLVSKNEKDSEFWRKIAENVSVSFSHASSPDEASRSARAEDLILWDAGDPDLRGLEKNLLHQFNPSKVFAITDEPLESSPELFTPPAFAHHIFRRYEVPADSLCKELIRRSTSNSPFGMDGFFSTQAARYFKILTNSNQKIPVLDDVRDFLGTHNVISRLVNLSVDGADELIMNGLFDAPFTKEQGYYRRRVDRSESFELTDRERVEVEIAVDECFVGIRVRDYFGSLEREKVITKLGSNFKRSSFELPTDDPGAGIGIFKVSRSSSMIISVKSGIQTEVIMLMGNKRSYRDLRLSFCFFSVINTFSQ